MSQLLNKRVCEHRLGIFALELPPVNNKQVRSIVEEFPSQGQSLHSTIRFDEDNLAAGLPKPKYSIHQSGKANRYTCTGPIAENQLRLQSANQYKGKVERVESREHAAHVGLTDFS
jgi:hypothetical protein